MSANKINVLFVTSWYPTKVKPTDGNFVQKHAEAVSLYANVDVLHVAFDRSLKKNFEYLKENRNTLTTHIIYLSYPGISFIKFIKYIRAYFYGYKQIYGKSGKPHVIHANILIPVGFIAFLLHLAKKIPYVITEHWTAYHPEDPTRIGKKLFWYKCFAKKSSRIIPVTGHLKIAMQSSGMRGHYSVVPNVVNTTLFSPGSHRVEAVKHIIHVSSLLDIQKNFSGILLALSALVDKRKDFVLDVVSDGDFAQYDPKIKKLNIADKVVFHGKKSTEDVAQVLKGGDFLLLFSNYENFPCVIAEAMACGLPVLSSDVGGIAEYINETNGILTEAQNIDALIAQLDKMLDKCRSYDKSLIREYAEKHFSYEVIGKQFLEIYKEVLCL